MFPFIPEKAIFVTLQLRGFTGSKWKTQAFRLLSAEGWYAIVLRTGLCTGTV